MESVEFRVKEIESLLSSDNLAVTSGIEKCNQAVDVINNLLKNSKSVGEKQKLTRILGRVESFKAKFGAFDVPESSSSRKQTATNRVKWSDLQSAFKCRIRTGVINNLKHVDPIKFLEDASAIFRYRIRNEVKKDRFIKVNTVFCGKFLKQKADEELLESKYFNTKNVAIDQSDDLVKWFYDNVQEPILKDLEEFQEKESGWTLSEIIKLQVNINKFFPQVASSYLPLPPQIAEKKACINVKNDDDRCFAWAVMSALYPPPSHPQRVRNYQDPSQVLKLKGIQFPMTMNQIPRFEKQNEISINVYVLEEEDEDYKVLPNYLTKAKKERHVNLLLIQEEDNNDKNNSLKSHYVWIKNLSRLVSSQLSANKGKKYICDRCLNYFYKKIKLDKHYENCVEMNNCKIRLPKKGSNIEFKNYNNKIKVPFIIYADLECLLIPCKHKNVYQEHKPCSIGYYVKCSYDDTLSYYRSYRGSNCISWFTSELENFAEDLEPVFLCPLPMDKLSSKEQIDYDNAILCHICEKEFTPENIKVRDHDHLTGRYRGPAHKECNVNFKNRHTVPVVFHNLSGYDAHFIIKDLANGIEGKIDILPITKEKYISFTKRLKEIRINFRFIDSFRFMASGLDTLASSLTEFPELSSQFPQLDKSKKQLLTRKGVYPYNYFDSDKKFDELELPSKSKFYNQMTESDISDEDYLHAQKVWKEFQCENLGNYSDLYLKTDVLLLADVFEQFRSSCLETYKLDPAHYYTLPGYTWDCMLKHTKITMELLTEVDMLMFIEKGIRGGLSQCSLRYAKANNKYMPDYESSKPSKYLLYTDINNQYGYAMSQYLPYKDFKWLSEEEIQNFNVMETLNEADKGYILEVDLEYPEEIHDLHNDIPFCPERRTAPKSQEKKLMATLYNKTKYVIHYHALKQAIKHGLKLTKIYQILEFTQSDWLKSYIDLNTELRKKAKNEFEKNLFKLMNNAVFGKTMENVRKYSNVKLISKWDGRYGAERYIAKPQFKNSTIFDENLVAIELNKAEIYFNKPIYVGMAILDISKTKIYEFHYEYMKPEFGDKCRAAYTDTDSIIYEVECPDIYDMIRRDCHERFDTSDYPENNPYNIPLVNKKVIGLMKDEMNGKIMTEFVGLRSKMYAIREKTRDVTKKAKGVKKHIVKKQITFDDFVDCLNNFTEKSVEQKIIKSNKHEVFSIRSQKIALSPRDDKRYIIPASHQTLSWGHYSIMDTST